MRKVIVLSLITLAWFVIPNASGGHFLDSQDVVKMIKSEFPLTKHDTLILDELNTIRGLVACGEIRNKLDGLEYIIIAAGEALRFFKNVREMSWNLIKDTYETFTSIEGWGNLAVHTADIIINVGLTIEDGLVYLGGGVYDIASDVGNAIYNFFGKRRRRTDDTKSTLGHSGSAFDFRKKNPQTPKEETRFVIPRNTIGPAGDMNILTWNRRLAQLAAVSQKSFYEGKRSIIYEGKEYRMFVFGGYLDYIVGNFLGEVISTFFKYVKVAYYACYIVLSGIDAPIYDKNAIKDSIHEALYGNSMEVGCVVGMPNSFCVIGPIKDRPDNMFYTNGDPATSCHYGSNSSLCTPPPSYFFALRDKYEGRLRPKISKFEIVDGFNASDNSTVNEFSVEWPMDDDDSFAISPLITVIIFLITTVFLLKN